MNLKRYLFSNLSEKSTIAATIVTSLDVKEAISLILTEIENIKSRNPNLLSSTNLEEYYLNEYSPLEIHYDIGEKCSSNKVIIFFKTNAYSI
jgi:hypothetical protein